MHQAQAQISLSGLFSCLLVSHPSCAANMLGSCWFLLPCWTRFQVTSSCHLPDREGAVRHPRSCWGKLSVTVQAQETSQSSLFKAHQVVLGNHWAGMSTVCPQQLRLRSLSQVSCSLLSCHSRCVHTQLPSWEVVLLGWLLKQFKALY